MKYINEYINESTIISIDEKLSIGDTIYKFLGNKVFGLDIKNQSEVLKMISKFMGEHSDNQVKTFTMNLKELDSKMNNCINKDDDFWYKDDMKFKEAISSRTYWNDCTLTDNTKWICFYNKENKDKFFAWVESPYFLTAKDKKGRRPLMGYPNLDINDKFSYGTQLLNIVKRVIDPEKWQKELEDQKAKEKEEEKKLAKKRIENIEKELEELKKIIDDK